MAANVPVNFSVDRRFLFALYLLALLSSAVFCVLHENITPLVVATAGGIIAWFVVDSRGKPLPKWVINTFLVLVAGNFFYEAYAGDNFNLMTSLGHFIVGLLMCKFFERKTPRDVTQILILSLLIVVASTMYSSSISFALVLVIYFGALVYTVILMNLRMQTQAFASKTKIPSLLVQNGQQTRFVKDLRRTALRSVLVLVPVALLVFLTMPRTGGSSLLSRWSASGTFQTGFSDQVQFQDYGQLSQSDAVAMEVTFKQNEANVGAEIVDPYFRGITLENYDPRTRQWTHEKDDDLQDVPFNAQHYALLVPWDQFVDIPPLVQIYSLQVPSRGVLLHLSPPLRVSTENLSFKRVAYSPSTGVLFPSNDRFGPSTYRVESLPRFDPAMLDAPGPGYASGSAPPDPEIVRMARNLAADLLPAEAAAAPAVDRIPQIAGRFESYLRSNYPYSLEFTRKDLDVEPITDFLLHHKDTGGHCEYFAAAMVMMCRSVHIPARMVTGYHGGEFNSLSGGFVVKQKNAHAWAEYYVPKTGWMHSDPSPITATMNYSQSLLARWSKEITQIIQNLWLSAVVTFDNESRGVVVGWVMSTIDGIRRNVVDAVTNAWMVVAFAVLAQGEGGRTDLYLRLSFLGPVLGILLVAGYLFRKWRRERRVRARYGTLRHPVRMSSDAHFLDELFRLVERKSSGVADAAKRARRLDQTPKEYIEAAQPLLGSAMDDARWLVSTFYGIQFGALTPTPEMRTQIAQALRRVKEKLRMPVQTSGHS